jgi:hypothetical protein
MILSFMQSSILRGSATRVGKEDPVGDYRSMVHTDEDNFEEATSQMQAHIRGYFDRPCEDDALVQKAVACLRVLREKSSEGVEEENFNTFGKSLVSSRGLHTLHTKIPL